MPDTKKLLGAAAFTAALAGGAVAGALVGAPRVSFAQDDGTTTTTAVDTTTDDSAAEGQECHPGEGRFGRLHGPGMDAAAAAIGIEVDELMSALRDGASIASVAADNGVEVQTVIDAMVAEATEHIDEAVDAGRIDEERAEELRADLPERIAELVEREGLRRRGLHHHRPFADRDAADAQDAGEDDGGS